MVIYSAEFPAKVGTTLSGVTELAKRWLTGGPHYPWSVEDFGPEPIGKLESLAKDGHEVLWGSFPSGPEAISALRHTWADETAVEWTTEIIAKQTGNSVWVATDLHATCPIAGTAIPHPKKPYLVNLLLKELGGGDDGGFKVSDLPISLSASDLMTARAIMRGELNNSLPVVYVSVMDNGTCYLDCKRLARELGGLAHVVVEPDRKFSFDLRDLVDGQNVYAGAIGVYWPQGVSGHLKFLPAAMPAGTMAFEVADQVRKAACAIRSKLSWSTVESVVSRVQADELRARGEQNVNQYIEAFGSELAAKEQLLNEANLEIDRLKAEIRRLSAEGEVSGGAIKTGNETDLFPGEIREIVVSVFNEALNRTHADSRSAHVLQDLIAANPAGQAREHYRDVIKRTLSTVRKLSPADMKALEEIGFSITDDGKHYKAIFCGDDRYTFAISKTSSDVRAGKNLVSQINRLMFS